MYTLAAILLAAAAAVIGISTSATATVAAQTFDITTAQEGRGEAVITVQLATNNTVVIPPNGTIIEVPGNITQVDNDTVVITPDNETVTPLPGNVTVITPPEPEPCGCPPVEEPATAGGPLAPVIVRPAPGQEVIAENGTELVANESPQEGPIPVPEEPESVPAPAEEEGNATAPAAINATEEAETSQDDNSTGLAPAASSSTQNIPWYMPFSKT
jgi:hypothetical protein